MTEQETLIEEFKKELGDDTPIGIKAPVCPLLIYCSWIQPGDKNEFSYLCATKGRETYVVFSDDKYRNTARGKFAAVISGATSLSELAELHARYDVEAEKLYTKYALKNGLKEYSIAELQDIVRKAYQELSDLIGDTLYIERFDKDSVSGSVDSKIEDRIFAHWEDMTHPSILSFENRRNNHILELLKTKDVDEVVPYVRYAYADYATVQPDAYIRERVADLQANRENVANKIAGQLATMQRNAKQLEEKLTREPEAVHIAAAYIQFVIAQRDLRKDPIARLGVVMYEASSEIFRRLGLPEEKVYSFNGYEIARLDTSHPDAIRQSILEREEGAIYLVKSDSEVISYPMDYATAVSKLEEIEHHDAHDGVTELRGSTASRGVARGKARVVLDAKNAEFEEGEILMTSMTRPEFVSIMKKAAAVVTNEGGITCHAAIVSRELGIPCIIGTKVATRVFKTGDRVEVDADNGVVRIIEKSD